MANYLLRLLLISLLFIQPLLFSPFTLLSFELPKVLLLYLFSVLTFSVVILNFKMKSLKLIHYLFLTLLGWIPITAIIGLNFSESFWGSYFRMQGIVSWLCYGLLFFISGKLFSEKHFRKQILWAILISSTFVACLALTQFISLWFLGNSSQLLYSNRAISTFGQPNFLGGFLVMSLPFIWYLYDHTNLSLRTRFISGVAISIVILGIFSTLSRSAYLGLAVLALIWGFYHYRLLLTGIVLSVLLFGIMAVLSPNLVYQQWYRFQVDTIAKWSAENRFQITEKSLQLISQRPLVGYGIENFSLAFSQVVKPADLGLKDIVVDSSHNLFLDLSVNLGVIGLILFLTILILTITLGLKNHSEDRDFIKVALAVVIGFIIIHQFSPVSIVPLTLFWIAMGIINPSALEPANLPKNIKAVFLLIGSLLVILTLFFILQTIRADNLFRKASGYEVVDIHKAISLDNEAIGMAPWINFYKIRRDFLLQQLGINVDK